MLKIISAQSWLEEIQDVDWGGDRPEHEPGGSIDESNYEDVLVDEIEEEPPVGPQPPVKENIPPDDYRGEIPTANELLGIPEDTRELQYTDTKSLVYDGIDNSEVISFDYTNRHGMYAGWRTVEPHYTFHARTTGNEVLVTFDRDVGDIRAFIVGNIHPYGVRYSGAEFDPRDEIMIGVY